MPEQLLEDAAEQLQTNIPLLAKRLVPAMRLRLLTTGLLPEWMR